MAGLGTCSLRGALDLGMRPPWNKYRVVRLVPVPNVKEQALLVPKGHQSGDTNLAQNLLREASSPFNVSLTRENTETRAKG